RFGYSLEGIGQTGHLGLQPQRAYAWFSGVTWKTNVWHRPAGLSIEYKLASGTRAGASNSGTYDQLSPANHDKFGHEDLFGWRNVHNARSVTTFGITKAFAINFMYDDLWLACLKDGIYSSSGKLIARSVTGTAGRHVGRETDLFAT